MINPNFALETRYRQYSRHKMLPCKRWVYPDKRGQILGRFDQSALRADFAIAKSGINKIFFSVLMFYFSGNLVFAGVDYNVDENGVVLKGYDAVAYFTEKKAVKGSSEYQYEWMGAMWWFSSEENKKLFVKDPLKYAPQYGGYCAYGVIRSNKADIDPSVFSIIDDKLYLNFNEDVKARWEKNISANIYTANIRWPQIRR